MKSNLISAAVLGKTTRSGRTDTRAKIIERVRDGAPAQFSSGPAFNWAFFAEENSVNNFEVIYKSQVADEDETTKDQTEEISLPTTATNSHDSRDDSVLGEDTHDPKTKQDSKALHSVLPDYDATVLNDVITNINDPGVGFAEDKIADASDNTDKNKNKLSFETNKEASFDGNDSIFDTFEEERSEATSPPKRRLFNCGGGADLDLIEDLNVTLRQIFSPIKNAGIVMPDKIKKMAQEKILSFKSRRRNSSGVAKNDSDESMYSGHSEMYSSKLDDNGKKRNDRVRVGTPEFKAMMSRRRAV